MSATTTSAKCYLYLSLSTSSLVLWGLLSADPARWPVSLITARAWRATQHVALLILNVNTHFDILTGVQERLIPRILLS